MVRTITVKGISRVHLAGDSTATLCGVKRVEPVSGVQADCPTCLRKSRQGQVVYLIHFETPYQHARHYAGFSVNLPFRLVHHRSGSGAKLLRAVTEAGIEWDVVRTWPQATRTFERKLKRAHRLAPWCPICSESPRMSSVQRVE